MGDIKSYRQKILDELRELRYSRFVENDRLWIRAMQIGQLTGDYSEATKVAAEGQALRDWPATIIDQLKAAETGVDADKVPLPTEPKIEPVPKPVDEVVPIIKALHGRRVRK